MGTASRGADDPALIFDKPSTRPEGLNAGRLTIHQGLG